MRQILIIIAAVLLTAGLIWGVIRFMDYLVVHPELIDLIAGVCIWVGIAAIFISVCVIIYTILDAIFGE